MPELTKLDIEQALIKWNYAAKTGCEHDILYDYLSGKHHKIYLMVNQCSLCEKYYKGIIGCSSCPLLEKWGVTCSGKKARWSKWLYAKTGKTRIKYATLIRDDIIKIGKERGLL
jgi:hypothetical protein